MDLIYPDANVILFSGPNGGSYVGAPFRGVLHTTQDKSYTPSTTSYYGHSNPPHFTLAQVGGSTNVYQHYQMDVAARALANPAGGVQTNRRNAIQIEIAWTAEDIENLPSEMKDALRDLITWISAQAGIAKTHPQFYGDEAYGLHSISRMSAGVWNSFNGWCGHQHVPENEHWDPGEIDIAYILS